MSTYRTPMPAMMAALLGNAINRLLDLDERSASRLQRLKGHVLRLNLEGLGISLFFAFDGRRVDVSAESDAEPDTVISGSPAALFSMAAPKETARWGSPGSRVTINGDASLARDLERLFSRLDPDWEGELSRIFGDVLGYQLAAGIRAGASQARESAKATGEMLGDYLQRRGGPLVNAEEIETFARAVDEAHDATERLEAKLRLIERDLESRADQPEDER